MTKSELLNEQDHNEFVKVLRKSVEEKDEDNRMSRIIDYILIFINGITVGILLSTLLVYILK